MPDDSDRDLAEDSIEFDIVSHEDDLACSISIELDNEFNGGRTCFTPGESFWVRVYSPVTYELYMTGGGKISKQSNVVETIPDPNDVDADDWEYVNFTDWSGSASKPIWSIINKNWCFHNLGTVNWRRNFNDLWVNHDSDNPDLGYGVLRIKYKSRFDRYELRAPGAGHDIKVVVYSTDVNFPNCNAELQVQIREDCVEARPKEITLQITNCVSEGTIDGVSVVITGGGGYSFSGVTSNGGYLYLGVLSPGIYSVILIHPDYWPSYADGVVNSQFRVD